MVQTAAMRACSPVVAAAAAVNSNLAVVVAAGSSFHLPGIAEAGGSFCRSRCYCSCLASCSHCGYTRLSAFFAGIAAAEDNSFAAAADMVVESFVVFVEKGRLEVYSIDSAQFAGQVKSLC